MSKSGDKAKPKRQVFEVEPRPEGWALQREKSQRASGLFETKKEAVDEGARRGHEIEESGGLAQLRIKKKDGRIQSERTYGDDPPRSKG